MLDAHLVETLAHSLAVFVCNVLRTAHGEEELTELLVVVLGTLLQFCIIHLTGTVCHERLRQGETSALAQQFNALKPGDSILAVFGPEGGLTENEIAKMNEAGVVAAGLGPRILRTETAPLYFMAAISYAMELS